ncbi:MAG TPA: M56 family metallopeptidase, partial [Thermoanaerobaculia bacterium]
MIAHLLESTLLLAIAILVAHMPRLAARTRYAIVFAALMKFAMPSSVAPRMLALFGFDLARMPKGTILIEVLGRLTNASLPATAPFWPAAATVVWLVIAAALLARSLILGNDGMRLALSDALDADERELAVLARARVRAGVARAVRLVRSPSITTPVTAGRLREVIVIPAGAQLGDTELEAILTHECTHIARHDNLLSILESIAGCVLWFHPLIWIA